MNNKIWIWMFVFFLVITTISATHIKLGTFTDEDDIDTIVQRNRVYDGKVLCVDANNYPCSTSVNCNFTVIQPNSSYALLNERMTRASASSATYNYTLSFPKTIEIGEYRAYAFCASNPSTSGSTHFIFKVVGSLGEITDATSPLQSSLLILLPLILSLTFFVLGLTAFRTSPLGLLFLVLGFLFMLLTSNYGSIIGENLGFDATLLNNVNLIFTVILWTFFIVFVLTIILNIKNYIEQHIEGKRKKQNEGGNIY